MSLSREELVGFALGALSVEETECVRREVASDAAPLAELKRIERHLALHARVPALQARPETWFALRERLGEPPERRPRPRRLWLPAAAAALVAIAFFWPRSEPSMRTVHGAVNRTQAGTYTCNEVSRVLLGDGVVLTLDAGTAFEILGPNRLALRAGRVFLDVDPGRSGFAVVAGELTAASTGTAFLVQLGAPQLGAPALVWTESGRVRCRWRDRSALVGPGETFFATASPPANPVGSPRDWFRRPDLTARILDARTIRVVIRNEMPDPIEVAPPTGGEPLFFASFLGHDYPLAPDRFAPLTLEPYRDTSFLLRLPRPLPDREALVLSYPAAGVRVEATR